MKRGHKVFFLKLKDIQSNFFRHWLETNIILIFWNIWLKEDRNKIFLPIQCSICLGYCWFLLAVCIYFPVHTLLHIPFPGWCFCITHLFQLCEWFLILLHYSLVLVVFWFSLLFVLGKIKFSPEKDPKYYLAKDQTCAHDIEKHCKSAKKENNFVVFTCLQDVAVVSL